NGEVVRQQFHKSKNNNLTRRIPETKRRYEQDLQPKLTIPEATILKAIMITTAQNKTRSPTADERIITRKNTSHL
ncbi:19324_t:CDS:1, partial [Gigaspora rosea]